MYDSTYVKLQVPQWKVSCVHEPAEGVYLCEINSQPSTSFLKFRGRTRSGNLIFEIQRSGFNPRLTRQARLRKWFPDKRKRITWFDLPPLPRSPVFVDENHRVPQRREIALYSEFLLIFLLSHTVCTYVISHSYKRVFVNIWKIAFLIRG